MSLSGSRFFSTFSQKITRGVSFPFPERVSSSQQDSTVRVELSGAELGDADLKVGNAENQLPWMDMPGLWHWVYSIGQCLGG